MYEYILNFIDEQFIKNCKNKTDQFHISIEVWLKLNFTVRYIFFLLLRQVGKFFLYGDYEIINTYW